MHLQVKTMSAKIFRYYRNTLTNDPTYITMRKDWRKMNIFYLHENPIQNAKWTYR